ncbi:MAG TPA: hypothetical protein VFX76_12830, partial [Roseiflexaceae bacterium]|nr:hypothetical protein [Roseiflexaceae bacterium]
TRAQHTPNQIESFKAAVVGSAPSLLDKARVAYRAGDITSARSLAQSALESTKAPPVIWPLAAGIACIVVVGALVGRRLLARRSKRKRAPARPDDDDVLAALLAKPVGLDARAKSQEKRTLA